MYVNTKSKITKAVIYRTGAFVTRTAEIHLYKGSNRVCFDKLSSSIVGETVQIAMPVGVLCNQVLYDAYHKLNQPAEICEESERIKELKKHKEELEDAITTVQFAYKTISKEFCFDKRDNFTVENLKEYVDYIYQKQNELLKENRTLHSELTEVCQEIDEYEKESKSSSSEKSILSGAVLLDMEAEQEGDYIIEIMAYDKQVSWEPIYDICVDNLMLPMSVVLKGKVYQNTGEIWEDVGLTVSTGNLLQSNNQPELKAWKLDFQQSYSGNRVQVPTRHHHIMYGETNILGGGETSILETATLFDEKEKKRRNLNRMLENQTSIEYSLSGTYTLQDTAQGNMIEIIRNSIEAEYCHYITPKAECSAYLMALVKNWRSMEWLECDANIFLENRYVGATHINPSGMDDLFKISLGRDRFITVSRHCLKKNSSQQMIGNMQSKDFEYQLEIRNEKNQQVCIMVIDQIPISDNEKITVDNVNAPGAEFEPRTGKITWNARLRPGGKLGLALGFRVRWPKGMGINI